jgi:hypothetical protein
MSSSNPNANAAAHLLNQLTDEIAAILDEHDPATLEDAICEQTADRVFALSVPELLAIAGEDPKRMINATPDTIEPEWDEIDVIERNVRDVIEDTLLRRFGIK